MDRIIIYSSTTCPHCQSVKQYLMEKGYTFSEKNVQENKEYRKELMDKGYRGVPVLIINGLEIVGFDKEKINQVLKI